MGLDIFLHKAHKVRQHGTDWESVFKETDKQAKEKLRKAFARFERAISKVAGTDEYNEVYISKVKNLQKYFNYPFMLEKMGVHYDYRTGETTITPMPIDKATEAYKKNIYDGYYAPYIGYFRKVNFIYEYFRKKLVDECAWVEKEDLEDIIDKCDKILANPALGEELLPTTSGFFFGSTEYDEYYLDDVHDAKEVFTKILKEWKDDEDVYIVMSW